jgi:hypothetical protein
MQMEADEARLLLGVSRWADPTEVDRAFRRLARVNHPDAGGDPSTFRQLVEARATLRTGSADDPRALLRMRQSRSVLTVRRSSARRVLHALRRRLPAAGAPRVR